MIRNLLRYMGLAVILIFITSDLSAHPINLSMEDQPVTDVFGYYIRLGFLHILPLGFDHILFVVSLFLLDPRLKTVLLQASCFTVAHSITLALTALGFITPDPRIIEPLITLSIAFMAVENLLTGSVSRWRYMLIVIFGMVHGMGFASALAETGLPRDALFTSLTGFNIGVELGQITILISAWLLVKYAVNDKGWYTKKIAGPLSLLIAVSAGIWTIERIIG